MPVRRCANPVCNDYVTPPATLCAGCDAAPKPSADAKPRSDAFYDRHKRDPWATKFYHSAAWKRAARTKKANNPVCQRCGRRWSRHVHHKKPLRECTPAERLSQVMLEALCVPCHNTAETELKTTEKPT